MIRFLIASVALVALVAGCGLFNKKPKAEQSALTDVVPPPAPQHTASTPMTSTPVTVDAAPTADSQGPVAGQKYVVKKGDTLWSLAVKTYGNGAQYKKIIAANPSIKNEKLVAGQTIVLPQ